MRKITIIAGAITMAFGLTAASGSAFAMGCLNNQSSLPAMSLSHNDLVPNAGFGYDKDSYDAASAKGNACPTTQQSQPVSDVTNVHKKKVHSAYN